MELELYGELLTASDESMTIDYNLLTFGEPGRTNKGTVTVDRGALQVPAGHMPVNLQHKPEISVGYMTASEHDGGLGSRVHYYSTPEGAKAYKEAKAGKRSGISVEVLGPIIRAGKLLAGLLVGAGAVEKPAFPSSLMLAADFGEDPESGAAAPDAGDGDVIDELADAKQALESGDLEAAKAAIDAALAATDEVPKEKEESTVPTKDKLEASAVPASLEAFIKSVVAGGGTPAAAPAKDDKLTASDAPKTVAEFADTLRSIHSGGLGGGSKLTAALATVTQEDVLDPAAQPEYLGELWADTEYQERFTPLVTQKDLTALTVKGWEWVEGRTPIADDWEPPYTQGDYDADPVVLSEMNDIPSRPIQAVAREWHAKRIAGGNRFDRAILDFPVPGQVESYLREQTEFIKRRRDARVRGHLISIAKPIVGTGNDVSTPWAKIILGCQHVLEDTKPDYAILGNDLYRSLLGSDMLENLALLETSLGLESGTMAGFKIQPASITDVGMNGRVIVGSSKVTVLHQTGGGAPIRVDAQELIKGAVDKAVFSYYLLRSNTVPGGTVELPTAYAKTGVFEIQG